MCGHEWHRQEDVRVCVRCGLTMTCDGKLVHDRPLPGALARVKTRGRKGGARLGAAPFGGRADETERGEGHGGSGK